MLESRSPSIALIVGLDGLFSARFACSALNSVAVKGIFLQRGFTDLRRLNLLLQVFSWQDIGLLTRLIFNDWKTFGRLKRKLYASSSSPLRIFSDINDSNILRQLELLKPEVIVSFNGVSKWPTELLSIPSIGCVNIHLGELPKYPGLSPVIQALAAGETQIAVCLHWMDESIDTGGVVDTSYINISEARSILHLHSLLNARASKLLVSALPTVVASERLGTRPGSSASRVFSSVPDRKVVTMARNNFNNLRRNR